MKPHPFPRQRPLPRSDGRVGVSERTPGESGTLTMERRREPRERVGRESSVTIAAAYSDGRGTRGIAPMELVDRSVGGLGVRTVAPLQAGMTIEVRGLADVADGTVGTVVRVEQAGPMVVAGIRVLTQRLAA